MSKIKTHKLRWIIIIAAALLVFGGVVYSLVLLGNDKTVADGVSVLGIDVGEMTRVDARQKIRDNLPEKLDNKDIELICGEETVSVSTDELSPEINVSETVDKVFDYGKSGSALSRLKKLLLAKLFGHEVRAVIDVNDDALTDVLEPFTRNIENPYIPANYVVEPEQIVVIPGKRGKGIDRKNLKDKLYDCIFIGKSSRIEVEISDCDPTVFSAERLHKIFACEPENAGFARDENGKIVVTDSKIGVDFNIKTAQKILDKAKGGEAFIPIVATKPDVKSDELSSKLYCDELSSYSSSYTVGNTGRAKNLELASSKLNGTELLPGEVFSYVGTVGNGTYEEGYVDAPVYADGEVATGVAGGICQGSSTLYCAVLFADLKVVERVNHSMPVGYVPYGMDATIATPYIDFKFSNSTDYPLKIEATASGGILKIRLIGTNTEPSKEVEISNKKIETIPYETKEIETEDLSPGEKRIKQNGSDGCVVETYKTINIDGAEKSTVKISTSRYSQIPKIVEIGKDSEDKKD